MAVAVCGRVGSTDGDLLTIAEESLQTEVLLTAPGHVLNVCRSFVENHFCVARKRRRDRHRWRDRSCGGRTSRWSYREGSLNGFQMVTQSNDSALNVPKTLILRRKRRQYHWDFRSGRIGRRRHGARCHWHCGSSGRWLIAKDPPDQAVSAVQCANYDQSYNQKTQPHQETGRFLDDYVGAGWIDVSEFAFYDGGHDGFPPGKWCACSARASDCLVRSYGPMMSSCIFGMVSVRADHKCLPIGHRSQMSKAKAMISIMILRHDRVIFGGGSNLLAECSRANFRARRIFSGS